MAGRILWASDTTNNLSADEKLLVTVVCIGIVTVIGAIVYKIIRSRDSRMQYYSSESARMENEGFGKLSTEDMEEYSETFAGQRAVGDAHYFPQGY